MRICDKDGHECAVCLGGPCLSVQRRLLEGPALNVRRECTFDNTGEGHCIHSGCEAAGKCLERASPKCPHCLDVRGDHASCKKKYAQEFLSAGYHEAVLVPSCMSFSEAAEAVSEYVGSLEYKVQQAVAPKAVTLPNDRATRKDTPIWSGFINYFPLAIAAAAQLSKSANEVHNPGEPLHWSKDKSNDHKDCMSRHLVEIDSYDSAPDHEHHYLHAVKMFWRAGAHLQTLLETGKPPRVKKGELP